MNVASTAPHNPRKDIHTSRGKKRHKIIKFYNYYNKAIMQREGMNALVGERIGIMIRWKETIKKPT